MVPEPSQPAPETVRYRVSPALPGLKAAGAVGIALLGLVFGADPVRLVLAGVMALGLLVWAARDLLAPVRLAADREGVTVVVGYAGRRRLPWAVVERVRVDTRPRFGISTATLEIDAGETLHLFSAYDLGAPPHEAAAELERLATA
jgi:hypothetical protein